MTMLTFDLVAVLQNGSGSNIGLPKRIGKMAFSSSSVAAVHCCAVMVPAGEWTAKCALSHCSGSPVVDPGSVQVPATHWEAAGAVVAHPIAHVVVLVPGSQAPATVDPLELELDPAVTVPPLDALPDAPLADDPVEPRLPPVETTPVDVSPPPDVVEVP